MHGYLPDLNTEYDFTRDHWPKAFLIYDVDQWHCSNCGGIFKQLREPAIPYCPWCGRKFVRVDSEMVEGCRDT